MICKRYLRESQIGEEEDILKICQRLFFQGTNTQIWHRADLKYVYSLLLLQKYVALLFSKLSGLWSRLWFHNKGSSSKCEPQTGEIC